MINFEELYTIFGDTLPVHTSDFFSTSGNQVLLSDLKKYNTGNNVRAYNIFKEKYYEFVSTRAAFVSKEPTAIEKLAAMKKTTQKEIVTK